MADEFPSPISDFSPSLLGDQTYSLEDLLKSNTAPIQRTPTPQMLSPIYISGTSPNSSYTSGTSPTSSCYISGSSPNSSSFISGSIPNSSYISGTLPNYSCYISGSSTKITSNILGTTPFITLHYFRYPTFHILQYFRYHSHR